MRRTLVPAAAFFIAAYGVVGVAAELKSGLQLGTVPGAFYVQDCTGPKKGQFLCYRCRYAGRPVVGIFARNIDENLTDLIKQVDAKVAKNKDLNMAAFLVLLTDDPDAVEPKLVALAKKHKIKHVPLTIFDGSIGPPKYQLAEEADVTVMMWSNTVKANRAFAKGKLDKKAVKKIAADTGKILN